MAAPTAKTKRPRSSSEREGDDGDDGDDAAAGPAKKAVGRANVGRGGAAAPDAFTQPRLRPRPRSAVLPVLRVRPALPDDTQAVERLRGQLENLHARLLPDYFRPSSGLRHLPPEVGVTTWVGEADRVVRGYVIARLVDAPIDPAMMPARRVQIVELCVEAAFRRLGIGTRLMDEVTAWGRDAGASEAVLTVWSHNRAAFGLYGELGFEPLARIMHLSLATAPSDAAKPVAGSRRATGPSPGRRSG